MAISMSFRSALNGFNRTDVVQFIQTQTTEHEKALRLLREENARLKEELDSLRARLAEAEQACAAQVAAEVPVPAPQPMVEEAPAPAPAPVTSLDAPIAPAASVISVAPADFNELELAAYRRAEMAERLAKERANASAERMRAVFAQADEKLNVTVQDFAILLETFHHDFDQIQQLLTTAQGIVSESSGSLKAAADICGEF